MTELAIIGSDIQEVLGSATALNILFGLKLWVGAIITIFDSLVFLFIHYFGVRKLELFFALSIIIMAITFGTNMFFANPDFSSIMGGILAPSVPEGSKGAALGLVGSVIMPHNLYLHSALVLTRKVCENNRRQKKEAIIYNNIESGISLAVSFVINTFIISTFAVYTLTNPEDRKDLDLKSAAVVLMDNFGVSSKYIWALGLLAAGQSSTMTGTYSGQFVMEGFLNIRLPVWQRVLVTRSIAIVPAVIVTFLNQKSLTNMDTALNIL